jgi:hypothetical protein
LLVGGLFCLLFLAVEEKYVAQHGCWEKNVRMTVSAANAFIFKNNK